MFILIFLLIFCDLHQFVFNWRIGDNRVLQIADCYMKAFYKKPPSVSSSDVISFNEAINPHLAFFDKIDDCTDRIKGIKTVKDNLFTEVKKWRENTKKELEEEYDAKILKFAPFPSESSLRQWITNGLHEDLKLILEFWQKDQPDILVEKFVKEYDEHFKSFSEKLLRKIGGRITRKMKEKYSNIIAEQYEEKQLLLIKRLYVNSYFGAFNSWCDLEKEGATENFKALYLIDMDNTFNRWRRQLSPFSLSLKSAYLNIAKDLIQKLFNLMSKDGDEELIRTLEGMLGRISKEIHTNTNIIEYSFLKDIFKFKKSLIKLNGALEVILNKVDVVGTEYAPQVVPQFPKIKRVFWFVRHGEKLDNDPAVKQTARQEKCYREGDRTFALDNSPLSDTGKSRAALLNGVFGNINIQHLFASPYERTVQTALNLLGNSHIKYDSNGNPQNYLEIKLEPGFMESMTFLESSKSPIGFDIDELNIHYEDYRIDWGHKSILDRSDLEEYKEEERRKSDISCRRRAETVLNKFIKNLESRRLKKSEFYNNNLVNQINEKTYRNEWIQPGEETADQIVIVTHGLFLCSVLNQIAGMFTYTPPTSIVKVVELDQDSTSEHGASSSGHGASSSSSTGINYLENLRLVHFGATKQFAEVFDEDNDYFEH